MSGLRINFYVNYMFGQAPADSMAALMTNLQSHGTMYLQTGNCFDKYAADPAVLINSADAYVQAVGGHPGSAGSYTIDVCQSFLVPGAFAQYQRLRSLDPDSMTFAALLGDVNTPLWRDATDVLATDPYPMYGAEPAGGYYHAQVADWTALARAAVKDARPHFTVLQFFQFTSLGRWPTLPEMRNNAYMAIVEGAKGLFWWSLGGNALTSVCTDWCAARTQYMDNLKAVVNELADLEAVLLADDAVGILTGNSNTAAIKTKVKVVNNRRYLLAYNYTNQPVTLTFTFGSAIGSVTVNAENRGIVASGTSFSDTFTAYQAHVYLIDSPTGAPPTWTFCANEDETCTFSGTKLVRYGANGTYVQQTATSSVSCNNATFGDPVVGVVKHCDYTDAPTTTWTLCANEAQTCTFAGTKLVRYGANGTYVQQTATSSISCNNATFGDPFVGVVKHCDYTDIGNP